MLYCEYDYSEMMIETPVTDHVWHSYVIYM